MWVYLEKWRKVESIMKSRLNGRNKIIATNTWAVPLMRYGAGIVKWTKSELDEIDRKIRKVMTMNKELHPRSDVNRLYVSSLRWYVKHHIEPLIVAVRISNTVPSENFT